MKIGYVRVSTEEQNEARQIEALNALGIEKLFIDKTSGKSIDGRPSLQEMLNFVRSSDVVITESISRIARNTKDLLTIISILNEKDVEFMFLKEQIDSTTAAGKFMITVFAAIAELERDNILERQKEGIAIAKRNGKYKGRVRIKINEDEFESVYKKWAANKITAKAAMNMLNIKPNTFYRRVKEYESINSSKV